MTDMTKLPAKINLQVREGTQNTLCEFELDVFETRRSEDPQAQFDHEVYRASIIDGLAQALREQAVEYLQDGGELAWLKALMAWAIPEAPAVEVSAFEQNVRRITTDLAELLIAKNRAYNDSALNPVRIFSKADTLEQLYVRIDDKLSRLQRGHEYQGDDTVKDLLGYLVLLLIARESA